MAAASASTPPTVESTNAALSTAVTTFEQQTRRAVAKVDKYLKKGANPTEVSVETKLEDFRQGVMLFNSGSLAMLVAAREATAQLSQCVTDRQTAVPDTPVHACGAEETWAVERTRLAAEVRAQLLEKDAAAHELAQRVAALQAALQKREETSSPDAPSPHAEALQAARAEGLLLHKRLAALGRQRMADFALLERLAMEHSAELAQWQSKLGAAGREAERLRVERDGLRGRLVDDRIRAQLREVQHECNRLRDENAKLRAERVATRSVSFSPITGAVETDASRAASGGNAEEADALSSAMRSHMVVALEREKLQLAAELSAAMDERLALEKELLLLRNHCATLEQRVELEESKRAALEKEVEVAKASTKSAREEENEVDIDAIHLVMPMDERSVTEKSIHMASTSSDARGVRNLSASNHPPLMRSTSSGLWQCQEETGSNAPLTLTTTTTTTAAAIPIHPTHATSIAEPEPDARVRELEAVVSQLESRLIDVLDTGMRAVADERTAAERAYQTQLHHIMRQWAAQQRETSVARAMAERQLLEARIETEQFRMRCETLQEALDDSRGDSTVTSTRPSQPPSGYKRGEGGRGHNSVRSEKVAENGREGKSPSMRRMVGTNIGRLDGLIVRLHHRIAALNTAATERPELYKTAEQRRELEAQRVELDAALERAVRKRTSLRGQVNTTNTIG